MGSYKKDALAIMKSIRKEYSDYIEYVNKYGSLHREDGPAIEYTNGDKHWYLNGKRHRIDGPAVVYASGSKFWFINGKLHREDGPATEYASGNKYYYLENNQYSYEEWDRIRKMLWLL